uniref:Uncharacterized protein n=1 Tax=Meloidogyne enterolobii TaxID=390850 RepID=A0A6V7VZH0_MELEN|nr:unnamed protein product [Meloidogyne enterolobii]
MFDNDTQKLNNYKSVLYEQIIEHISTSTNCSMVPVIILNFFNPKRFKLSKRAEKVEVKKSNGVKYINYQIANIHNPKMKFSFCNKESNSDDYGFDVEIKIFKE